MALASRTLTDHLTRLAALGCAVPRLLIRLTFDDGLILDISHEPGFAPDCGPCRLRDALSRQDHGCWVQHLVAADLCGPFVTIHPGGVVSWSEDGIELAAVAVRAPGDALASWLREIEPPHVGRDAIEGNLLVYPDLGTHVVALSSTVLDPRRLVNVAEWIDRYAAGATSGGTSVSRRRPPGRC